MLIRQRVTLIHFGCGVMGGTLAEDVHGPVHRTGMAQAGAMCVGRQDFSKIVFGIYLH
jgi:hypothetical protein